MGTPTVMIVGYISVLSSTYLVSKIYYQHWDLSKLHKSLQSHLNQRVEELEAEIEQAKAESEKYRQKFKGVI